MKKIRIRRSGLKYTLLQVLLLAAVRFIISPGYVRAESGS